ncbi:MAG: GTP-binding protein [Asgard group archaeon]|nr:GTP-binding protein [Asgard group archaeon]
MRAIEKIAELMKTPINIRNIALVAHIDHGKTTLSDSLLVSAGILAPSTAGEARALDFLPEEQRRGITMKTANISLSVSKDDNDYLINLIDSPGHVDFSGKVARALRIADGAIVVIDAVEQVMAQTETVVRQCISEGVKPILFINKIDRLITELQFTKQQIAERIEIIYNNFNDLIARYSQNPLLPKWKCTTRDGSVVFGSALHRWAISVPLAKEKGLSFQEIIDFYNKNEIKQLQQLLPIEKPLIDMIIQHLPDPQTAQKYRTGIIWNGDLSSKIGLAMSNCEVDEEKTPLVFGVTKILQDPHSGILTLGRIFSGILKPKSSVRLISSNEIKKIQNLYVFMGSTKKRIDLVPAGNIVAISGLSALNPGETLVSSNIKSMIPFEDIRYLATPVVTVALEPEMLRDLAQLKRTLERFDIEDPNLLVKIDDQSGEILLMGLGELHLETVVHDISNEIACKASAPLVVIIEKIAKSSGIMLQELFGSKVKITIEPYTRELNLKNIPTFEEEGSQTIKYRQYSNEILLSGSLIAKLSSDSIDNILVGVQNALSAGPISGKPISEARIFILDFETSNGEKFEHTVPLLRNSVWEALRKGDITTQEPIYKIQITVPSDYLGKVTSIINKRRGNVLEVRSNQDLLIISGSIPVAESFKIDQVLRSDTEGRAFWQMAFDRYEKIPASRLEELGLKK